MEIKYERLHKHVFVTKLAGFEHTKYIQKNQTKEKINNDDIPMVQGKNIRNGFFVEDFDWYIKKEISLSLERSRLTKNCILVPYVGSNLGDVGIFYHNYDCHLASNIAKIELIDDYFDLEYLKYYLQSPIGQGYLFQSKQGSAQPNVTMEAIRNTMVVDFPIDKQKKISHILKVIDLKFQNNIQIISELELLSKTLYDYWFLQFDFPNEAGKPYKTSGGKMVWNKQIKRMLPEKWEASNIYENFSITTGKRDASFASEDGAYSFFTCSDKVFRGNEKSFFGKAILLAGNGNFNVKAYEGEFDAYQRTYVIQPKNEEDFGIGYLMIKAMSEHLSKGSAGSIVKFITISDVNNILFFKQNDVDTKIFNILLEKTLYLQKENEELLKQRNFILPLLINGQATFKEK